MTSSQSVKDDVCQKLRGVGLPKGLVIPLVNLITRQVQAEGPENVVKRLKVLKQAAIYELAGQRPVWTWVAHTDQGPKGPWKPVWKMLKSSSYKHKKRALNALMVYSNFVLPKSQGPTVTQERKFLGSVEQENRMSAMTYPGPMFKGLVNVAHGTARLRVFLARRSWSWYDHESCEFPDVREFVGTHFGVNRQVKKSSPLYRDARRAVEKTERSIERFLGTDGGRVFHPFPQVKTMLGEVGEDYADLTHPWNGFWWDYREMVPASDPIGVVGYTHEPGFKFRAFAAPNPVLQAALEPMKRSLLEALSILPWDCTHNQQSGVADVQAWLRQGLTVFSVDLSDATNNFPLDIQLKVLQSLGAPEQDLRLLWLVARSPYRKTWGDGECVTWNVGQPLGAAPSFPMFALAHAAVALTAEWKVGIPARDSGSTFRILGDDFVCCHPGVHEAYRDLLRTMGCPVSEAKCLQSPLAGEFAGKLITDRYVYHGYKYRGVSDLSFMDVVRTLGPQAISPVFLSPKQLDYCKLVAELPEPIGLGFNPKGRPYAERYEEALYILEALEKRRSVPERYRRAELVNRVVYQFRHRWWGYLQADKFRGDGPQPKRTLEKVTPAVVDEVVRGEPLVAKTTSRGDPRVNVLQSMFARVLDVKSGLERLGRLRGSNPEVLDCDGHRDLPPVSTLEVKPDSIGCGEETPRETSDFGFEP